jgi:DNA-binding transcriptional LysR family regulator
VQIHQLEAFVETAIRGSVHQAARALHVTQPALTSRLHKLEEGLGVPLFVRTSAGMDLTPLGQSFLPYAQDVLRMVSAGRDLMTAVSQTSDTPLCVGLTLAECAHLAPGISSAFTARYPGARLDVCLASSTSLVGQVVAGQVDIGLVPEHHIASLRDNPHIKTVRLYEERPVLVCTPHAPIRILTLPDHLQASSRAQFIKLHRQSTFHGVDCDASIPSAVRVEDVVELDDILEVKRMVYQGLGVAVVPRSSVISELEAGLLERMPLESGRLFGVGEPTPWHYDVTAVWRAGRDLRSPVRKTFIDLLGELRVRFEGGSGKQATDASTGASRQPALRPGELQAR